MKDASGGVITITRLGPVQVDALSMHIFDPCLAEWADEHPEDAFPGSLEGGALLVTDREQAYRLLTDAGNECDREGDREFRDALFAVATRVLRANV